jgi:cell division protein FtsB
VSAVKAIAHFLKHIRIVYTRSSILLKCVVLTALLVSAAALLTLRGLHLQELAHQEALRAQAAELEQDNHRLAENIAQLGTLQGIRRIANEELDLVDPDTIIFVPEE